MSESEEKHLVKLLQAISHSKEPILIVLDEDKLYFDPYCGRFFKFKKDTCDIDDLGDVEEVIKQIKEQNKLFENENNKI